MSTSPQPRFESGVPQLVEPQQQELITTTRRRPTKFLFKQLKILPALIALVFLLWGCTNSASLSISTWALTRTETAKVPSKVINPDDDAPVISLAWPIGPAGLGSPATPIPAVTNTPLPPSPTPLPTSLPAAILTPTLTPTSPLTSTKTINYAVIISVDGLRPDALDFATTPNLDNLRAQGAYCPQAQTVKISETLPSHASMLTGMIPEKHGILWGLPYIGWPGITGPTLFSVAHAKGLSTGMVFGKQKMNYLILPASVDQLFGQDAHDLEIKEQAVEMIQTEMPDVLFIHFPDTDRVGHAYGWMSPNQFEAVTYVDGLIGEIVAALDTGGYLDNTLLIITADHGGHGLRHGDDSPEDRTIPWLAVGPGVPPGLILYTPIRTMDTAATVLYALDLPIPENWDGQPVLDIFPETNDSTMK